MNNRWHMNRIGFVNFWLYDEEIFQLSEGKLLLRGQNGSGKSITTQSFIPFILDGDRTPSRLDPFGSSDRKMDYYFLGEDDRDDVTGYLFLEFKRENTSQYRTIGIGQRARRGKTMDFWGFMLLDGQRISDDFKLYREIGQKKIPFSKQELKNALGKDNLFAETRKDYMAFVNRYIFGFPKIEQYDQFIKLLIKVRAPKLSKEFKPTKVYEILNDSLQTLSDEDLRAMVDAMEKMDDIQHKLENLKEARKDVLSINKEYQRYNQYMLAKKAQAYLNGKQKADLQEQKFKSQQDEWASKKEETEKRALENKDLQNHIYLLEQEKKTLDISDIETSVDELSRYKGKIESEEQKKKDFEERIEKGWASVSEYSEKRHTALKDRGTFDNETDDLLKEMKSHASILGFTEHEKMEAFKSTHDLKNECDTVRKAAAALKRAIVTGLKALENLDRMNKEWSDCQEYFEELNKIKERCAEALEDAQGIEDASREEIIEAYFRMTKSFEELTIDHKTLNVLSAMIQQYTGAVDLGEIQKLVQNIREIRYQTLKNMELQKKRLQDVTNISYRKAEKELEKLKAMKDPVPKRREKVEIARNLLKAGEIRCVPFYEVVEFAKDTNETEQALLEEQLTDAGLLDALIVSEKDQQQAKAALKTLSDVVLNAENRGGSTYNRLVAAELEEDLKAETEKILSNFYEENKAEALFVLEKDGCFKNGVLEGHSVPDGPASYIGAIARKKKKERLISDQQAEVDRLRAECDVVDEAVKTLEIRLLQLDKEYEALPKFDDLNQAITLKENALRDLDYAEQDVEKQKNVSEKILHKKREYEQEVIRHCKLLPYARKREAYEEAEVSITEYIEGLSKLEVSITRLKSAQADYEHAQEMLQKEETYISDNDLLLKQADHEIQACNTAIIQLEEFLNNPENREKAERLKEVKEEIKEKNQKVYENQGALKVLSDRLDQLTEELTENEKERQKILETEAVLRRNFTEELSLKGDFLLEEKTILTYAKEAAQKINENDKNRSPSEMTTSLHEAYQKYGSNLSSGYGMRMESCFEDDPENLKKRQRIVFSWDGKKGNKLYIEEFIQLLKESIESTELLIQKKDRELFENILADTLSRKLSRRITESKKWIQDMSELMQKMETSMALNFSLNWKPKAAEGSNELGTKELERLLIMNKELMKDEDIERVAAHFRSKVQIAKLTAEENGEVVNYADLVREALDYRQWFEFKLYYHRSDKNKKELTNSAFNRFSGGEKAMAMYVPLFAAVNAQYKKSDKTDHPRIIALDEAFAGVDETNISSMFELVQQLDFDYIMNSQSLWGCYSTVPTLRIAELLRPGNASVVTVIYYQWNGHEKKLMG